MSVQDTTRLVPTVPGPSAPQFPRDMIHLPEDRCIMNEEVRLASEALFRQESIICKRQLIEATKLWYGLGTSEIDQEFVQQLLFDKNDGLLTQMPSFTWRGMQCINSSLPIVRFKLWELWDTTSNCG